MKLQLQNRKSPTRFSNLGRNRLQTYTCQTLIIRKAKKLEIETPMDSILEYEKDLINE